MTRIILASKSPRRRELMEMLKLPFEIIVSDIDEQIDYDNDLVKEIEKLSFRKADAVYQENKDALVIGSDTIVKIGNDVLGKPKSVEQAKEMLRELSDNTHEVVTGVTIICNDDSLGTTTGAGVYESGSGGSFQRRIRCLQRRL